jgi:hypothetical protein
MHIEWRKVTWYSKLLAMALFVALPFAGFLLGARYGWVLDGRSFPITPESGTREAQTPAAQTDETENPTTSTSPNETAKEPALSAKKIVAIKQTREFSLPSLPNVVFRILGAQKAAGGVSVPKCGSGERFIALRQPSLFSTPLTCVDTAKKQPGDEGTALIVVELEIENKSNAYLRDRYLQLFFNHIENEGNETVLAQPNPPLDGYGARPQGTQRVLIGFEVPENQNEFQLVYGSYGKPGTMRTNEDFFSQSVSGFVVDFAAKTITEILG